MSKSEQKYAKELKIKSPVEILVELRTILQVPEGESIIEHAKNVMKDK